MLLHGQKCLTYRDTVPNSFCRVDKATTIFFTVKLKMLDMAYIIALNEANRLGSFFYCPDINASSQFFSELKLKLIAKSLLT